MISFSDSVSTVEPKYVSSNIVQLEGFDHSLSDSVDMQCESKK